jgi:hypothetical protein
VIVVIAIVLAAVGAWIWGRTQGTTFTKSSVRGIQFDPMKGKAK